MSKRAPDQVTENNVEDVRLAKRSCVGPNQKGGPPAIQQPVLDGQNTIGVLELVMKNGGDCFELKDLQALMSTSKSVSGMVQNSSDVWNAYFPARNSDSNDGSAKLGAIPRLKLVAVNDNYFVGGDPDQEIPKEYQDPRYNSAEFLALSPFAQVKALMKYKHAVCDFIAAPMDEEEQRFLKAFMRQFLFRPCTWGQFQKACRSLLKWEFDAMGVEQYIHNVIMYGWSELDLHDVPMGTDMHRLLFGDAA